MRMLPNSRQPVSNFCNIFIFYTIRQENLSFEWLSPIVSKVSRLYGKNGRLDGKQGRLKTYRGVPYAFRRPFILTTALLFCFFRCTAAGNADA